jgi:hypothetical protein
MGAESAIQIEGLAQFVRNLKKLDSDLPKAVRVAFNGAADLVVSGAQGKVPRHTGRAARSIKAQSTRTEARVSAGGNKAPYYPWLDFGGRVGKSKSVYRPVLKSGRYIYPTFFALRSSGQFEKVMTGALLDVARSAGIEVE